MLIIVGSANPIEESAVEQAFKEYEDLRLAKVQAIESLSVRSEIFCDK